jgi:dipeptidyl aminopeptidase/acylaminoacyl peptidase
MIKYAFRNIVFIILFTVLFSINQFGAGDVYTAKDLLRTQSAADAIVSPNGDWIAYTIYVPRTANDKAGSSYKELYIASTRAKQIRPFITGKVSIGSLQWSPDSLQLAFKTKRGKDAKSQVWVISLKGGESVALTHCETGVNNFHWHPNGKQIAFTAKSSQPKKEKALKEKGYGFIYFEENLKHINLFLQDISNEKAEVKQLTKDITIKSFCFSPDGKTLAVAAIKKNLVDYDYAFKHIYLLDIASGKMEQLTQNPGKLGKFKFSPDGSKLVYTGAFDRKDHAVSQVYVVDIKTKQQKNLTIPDFRGHVSWATWKDNKTLLYSSGEGVNNTLSLVPAAGGNRKVIMNTKDTGYVYRSVTFSKDFKHAAFSAKSPNNPGEVFYWQPGPKKPVKITNLNPWLKKKKLGKQEKIVFKARDGLEIEGLLMYPVDYKEGQKYPLVVFVHGGPESHHSNAWLTRYATPGQVMAGKGYAVAYFNYRASTGYGVKFALHGFKDPAGKEFDDVADGIDFLVKKGIADKDRVGLGGGSYGGYAAAWFGTYYTKKVRAVCMFVGISDLISKKGTTDIPYEELYVHSGERLKDSWQKSLERSPIYYAHQSKSAVLIFGGADDPRVHPTQSMELYRRLKMNNHPAVRLVQYPGEGHGNRKQPGRIDVVHRVIQWYDWYVKDKKDFNGPMPALDLSDMYGLDLK